MLKLSLKKKNTTLFILVLNGGHGIVCESIYDWLAKRKKKECMRNFIKFFGLSLEIEREV